MPIIYTAKAKRRKTPKPPNAIGVRQNPKRAAAAKRASSDGNKPRRNGQKRKSRGARSVRFHDQPAAARPPAVAAAENATTRAPVAAEDAPTGAPVAAGAPSVVTRSPSVNKKIQAVLNADKRGKLKMFLETAQSKQSKLFEAEEDWPKVYTYFVILNEIIPNISGTESQSANKHRTLPQILVCPLTKHSDHNKKFRKHLPLYQVSKEDSMYTSDTASIVQALKKYDDDSEVVSASKITKLTKGCTTRDEEIVKLKSEKDGMREVMDALSTQNEKLKEENLRLLRSISILKQAARQRSGNGGNDEAGNGGNSEANEEEEEAKSDK